MSPCWLRIESHNRLIKQQIYSPHALTHGPLNHGVWMFSGKLHQVADERQRRWTGQKPVLRHIDGSSSFHCEDPYQADDCKDEQSRQPHIEKNCTQYRIRISQNVRYHFEYTQSVNLSALLTR